MINLAETMTVCRVTTRAVWRGAMDNTPWQRRLKRAGLNQKQLARLVDLTEQNCSKALRGELQSGTPRYLINFIRVWERLPVDARDEVLALAELHEDETSVAYKLQAPSA